LSTQERTGTVIFGLVLVLLGIFWAYSASKIPVRSAQQAITPVFLPYWAGIFLALAGTLVVFAASTTRAVAEDPDDPLFEWSSQARVWIFLAILLAYILLLEQVHYLFLTGAAMLLTLIVAREPLGIWLLLKTVVTAVVMFAVFVLIFD